MARLAGNVQGVVVQMAMLALSFHSPVATGNLHVNRGVVALLIFHFGFGERGLRAGAPEDRLLRLVHQAFLNENRERAQDFRFVLGIHRQIWMFPVAEHAEPLELFALDVDEFSRKRFASFSGPPAEKARAIL